MHTATDVFSAGCLIVTAGSWTKALLAQQGIDLPLKIMPCQLGFYRPDRPTDFTPGRFPVFFAHMDDEYGEMPYGIPHDDEFIGVKVTTFYGWQTVDHPSEVNYTPSKEWVEQIRNFSRRYIPGVAGPLVSTRRCLYTVTPDKHFVIDRHPEFPHIVFGAGFSGHGFKFTTLVGKMLSELALLGETQYNTSLFKLSRFQQAAV